MSGINKVILVGNLGADPEFRSTASGRSMLKFNVATTSVYKKDGQKHEETQWHRVIVWGNAADSLSRLLGKGRKVYIEGSLKYGSYEKDGHTFYTTDIHAFNVTLLDRPPGGQRGGSGRPERREEPEYGDDDDDFGF